MSFARQDYLDNRCTHEQYYDQYVSLHVKNIVIGCIGRLAIVRSNDTNFNDIDLSNWDALGSLIVGAVGRKKFQELGDVPTLNGIVCIAKTAARQIRDAELQTQV